MKTRLDAKLVQLGLAPGRDKAKAIIMAGIVYVNGQKADKAGTEVTEKDKIELHGEPLRYVSRGGLKLEKAFASFPIQIQGAICMDIGASTGGFTDCMLQNGAQKVYAIDVGYGQLAWKLRTDTRVINPGTNQFSSCYPGTGDRTSELCKCGCLIYFSYPNPSGGAFFAIRRWGNGLSD